MLPDTAGNFWFSSENGVFGFSKQALLKYKADGRARPAPWRLTTANGLPNKVCSGYGQPVAQLVAGHFWFPNGPALVGCDTREAVRPPRIWAPLIDAIRADGASVPVRPDQSVRVVSGTRSVELNFTSPNILFPDALRFRYRLEGLEKDWSEASARRSAQYSRLPPGEYVFQVMAGSSDSNWNPAAARLRVVVVPRFWETRWFQAGAALLFVGGLTVAIWRFERARNRRKLAAMEQLNALERERNRIARDIHDDLGASLTEMALLSDMAGHSTADPQVLREQTEQISRTANQLVQSLEAIVWAVRPENDSLRSLLEFQNRRTDELFEKMPRKYQFELPASIPDCSVNPEVRHNVFLTCKEALTNTIKHAEAKTVGIRVEFAPGECRIAITDDGKGFQPGQTRAGGTGLKNMRQRLEEIGGKLELQSRPGQGTTVRLVFPLAPPPPSAP
jgi:signal transduction histidine kinase